VTPASPPLRFAVVGLGYWGPNLLRVLMDIPDVEVTWICDLDPARLERFGRRYPGVIRTARYDDVLRDPSVDAVLLATPIDTHYPLAMRAIADGKHPFVEKPLASSTEQANELMEEASDNELVLMCGHTFLYSPPVREIRSLVASDQLGEIFFISSSRVNLGLHQRDVSVVWDLGPHDFSILMYWLEELPDTVRAVGRDSIVPGIADVAFITATFPSGVVANVELSWLAPSKLRRTVVVGSKKMVVYEDGTAEPVRVFDRGVEYQDPETFGEYHLSYRTGDILSPNLETFEPLSMELFDFANAIRTGARLESHTSLARDVVCLTEAADLSLRNGGQEVVLDRPSRAFAHRNGNGARDGNGARNGHGSAARHHA
jgi:predicted dehydrogenase